MFVIVRLFIDAISSRAILHTARSGRNYVLDRVRIDLHANHSRARDPIHRFFVKAGATAAIEKLFDDIVAAPLSIFLYHTHS
jgi:hypothetical protein